MYSQSNTVNAGLHDITITVTKQYAITISYSKSDKKLSGLDLLTKS